MRFATTFLIIAMVSHLAAQADIGPSHGAEGIEISLLVEGVILDAGFDKDKQQTFGMMVVKKIVQGEAREGSTLCFGYYGRQLLNPGSIVRVEFTGDRDSLRAERIAIQGNVFDDRGMPIPKSKLPQRSHFFW